MKRVSTRTSLRTRGRIWSAQANDLSRKPSLLISDMLASDLSRADK